jgi:hypothetical protein
MAPTLQTNYALIIKNMHLDCISSKAYNLPKIELSDLSRAQYSQMIENNREKYAYKSDALSVAQLYEFVNSLIIHK